MMKDLIDCGGGLTIRPATAEDVAWVHAHLRDGDRMEHEFAQSALVEASRGREVAVELDGRLVGYAGGMPLQNESIMSRRRFVYYLSTTVADEQKVRYVRRSRDAMRAFLRTAPRWVDEFVTVPMLKYRGAVRWLERVLGFRRVEDFTWRGERFAVYSLTRKELEAREHG